MSNSQTESFASIQEWIKDAVSLRRVVISGKRKSARPKFLRIAIRPVLLKGVLHLQTVSHDGKQDFTRNFLPHELDVLDILEQGYANILIERSDETLNIRISKSGEVLIHRTGADSKTKFSLEHDRQKSRLLSPDNPIFYTLGISTQSGELIPRQSDKYRQVDDFLRIISTVIEDLNGETISIADLGCGNAYLTFAVHRYLTDLGKNVRVIGVDSKSESLSRNQAIAEKLGLADEIEFIASPIAGFAPRKTSLVIALHACNTATDDAIAWAIKSEAKAILVAPCCHHELNKRLKPPSKIWDPFFRNGIVKERFADLLTDSLRAEILRLNGYRADIIEFVSLDHTPRNLLIRATYTGNKGDRANYEQLTSEWAIKPYLEGLLA